MADLIVTITRYAGEHQPGWVECEFADADGRMHRFLERGRVVSQHALTAASEYPRMGRIACLVAEEWGDHSGIDLARIILDVAGANADNSYVILASDLR
jgi:hypothetical protein